MKIPYASRSGFTSVCEDAIGLHTDDLNSGRSVSINLEPGGYAGRVEANISVNDSLAFDTNWAGSDPTRFPARIKAAATALYRRSFFGRFEIAHDDGIIQIKRI